MDKAKNVYVRLLPYCPALGWVKKSHSGVGPIFEAGRWVLVTPEVAARVMETRQRVNDDTSLLAFQQAPDAQVMDQLTREAERAMAAAAPQAPQVDLLVSAEVAAQRRVDPAPAEPAAEPAVPPEAQVGRLAATARRALDPAPDLGTGRRRRR